MAKRAWCQHTRKRPRHLWRLRRARGSKERRGPTRVPWGGPPRVPAEAPPQSLCSGEHRSSQQPPVGLDRGGACADWRLPGPSTSRRWLSMGPGANPDGRTDSLSLTVDFRVLQSVGSPCFAFWTKLNTLASNCLLFDYRWDMIY